MKFWEIEGDRVRYRIINREGEERSYGKFYEVFFLDIDIFVWEILDLEMVF